MAEYIFKNLMEKKDISGWTVSSAGIYAVPEAEPNPKACKALEDKGINISEHRTTMVDRILLKKADIVLTMTKSHKEILSNQIEELKRADEKIFTLKEFIGKKEVDINDPYGQPLTKYQEVRDELINISTKLLGKLEQYFREKGFLENVENSNHIDEIKDRSDNMSDNMKQNFKIAIGSDHAGFKLKQDIINFFEENDILYKDMGVKSEDSVDYPEFAEQVANGVAENKFDRGILICGTGIGMSIAANKVQGVRAALCHDVFSAKATRYHNNSNVLAMGGRVIGRDLALEITKAWLNSEFKGDSQPRHQRRIDKIKKIENNS